MPLEITKFHVHLTEMNANHSHIVNFLYQKAEEEAVENSYWI